MPFPLSLTLQAHKTWTRSWQACSTMTYSSGHIASRDGAKVAEGWRFSWSNGIADFGFFHRCWDLTKDGDVEVFGRKAQKVRKTLRKKSGAYAREGRHLPGLLWANFLSIPLRMLALVVSFFTLPVFIAVYLSWLIIGGLGYLTLRLVAPRLIKSWMKTL